jgi:hypothetical protein
MIAKLAKLAEPRAIEAVAGAIRLIHSGDNQRTVGPTRAGQQNRRQALVCQWHSVPAEGRLECSWHIEPGDDSLGEGGGNALTLSQLLSLLIGICLLGSI